MLQNVNPNFYDFAEQQYICSLHPTAQQQAAAIAQYNDALDEAIYGSDEFRMYAYKIKRCTRLRSHDWTECPYAHRGEKAQRRDPRKFPYTAIACPAFRTGKCPKGDGCEFAHGVFEYWLHPARYRTRACNAGRFCQRKVCFFAHTPEQLRAEPNYSCHFAYKGKMTNGGDHHHHHHYYYHPADQPMMAAGNIVIAPSGGGGGEGSSTSMQGVPAVVVHERPLPSPSASAMQVNRRESGGGGGGFEGISGVSDLLKSLKALKMREDEEEARERLRRRSNVGGVEVMDSDLPDDLEWISDLVK
ncbi:Zinc finger, CCCH-type [Corchorus olitorius]|uniref:Zinc finger, CCCH-type n=1 Tax=Corchorus olitorius TaxID=93759 RepID=A0A1R3G2D1_9ROSI|nr:Zinc finger, CCCH-type [Corchorus olitorius]